MVSFLAFLLTRLQAWTAGEARQGQGLIEYSLILLLCVIAVFAAVGMVGSATAALWSLATTMFPG